MNSASTPAPTASEYVEVPGVVAAAAVSIAAAAEGACPAPGSLEGVSSKLAGPSPRAGLFLLPPHMKPAGAARKAVQACSMSGGFSSVAGQPRSGVFPDVLPP